MVKNKSFDKHLKEKRKKIVYECMYVGVCIIHTYINIYIFTHA